MQGIVVPMQGSLWFPLSAALLPFCSRFHADPPLRGMIITEKKRAKKESQKAKKTDAPEDRYVAFVTNAPWMDVEEYSKR